MSSIRRVESSVSILARHLRALVIAVAVLALSATVVLGARGLPTLTAALTGSGTTAAAGADAPDEDATAPDEDGDPDADTDEPGAAEQDGDEDADAPAAPADAADAHGTMVSEAAGMETPDGFANHGAFVSCVARQNHGHLAPDATPIPLGQLTPEDCAKDPDGDAGDTDATAPDASPATSEKTRGKSASAHDKTPKGHGQGQGKGKGHGH
jgi:hypothetical protein